MTGSRGLLFALVPSASRTVRLSVVVLLAACQPQARRLLLLDLALSDPLALESTAQPWHDAGYTVHYRRFYPHLTWEDLRRYRVLLLLGGREPEAGSDALGAGDLALLTEWVRRGGVAVLGYAGDGEGFLDRWIMNRWLEWMGTGILIGDFVLEDTTAGAAASFEPQPRASPAARSPLRDVVLEAFPASRNHVLLVKDEDQVLARTTATAFVRPPSQKPASRRRAAVLAASRVGPGLALVASRHALAALGAEYRPSTTPALALDELARTRAFLVALARWTRRPAEWASVPPADTRARVTLSLGDGPRAVAPRPPRLAPPADVQPIRLPTAIPADARRRPAGVPGWIERQGMRMLWAGRGPLELEPLIRFLEAAGLNAVASIAPPQAIADSSRYPPTEREGAIALWRRTAERLQATSLRWIPALDPRDETWESWCALDERWWNESLAPAARALAQLAAGRPDLIPAITFDLEPSARPAASHEGMESAFCDASFRAVLEAMRTDTAALLAPERADRLAALPVPARYDSLLEGGLLERYTGTLERLVAMHAAAIRAEMRRIRPDLLFGLKSAQAPADWFTVGLLRGFSGGDAPVLLWSREVRTRELLARYRQRGVNAIHAVGVPAAGVPPAAWPRLRRAAFDENDGFWIVPTTAVAPPPVGPDSLARLVRRLAKER